MTSTNAATVVAALLCITPAVHAQTREGFATVPGARLHYRDSGGAGTPVIFLHAATGNCESWEYQIPAFTAAGYRVITYDRRGWGHSTVEQGTPPAWTATGDLLALADQLRLDRFHLLGTALGGFVAFDFAISSPDRLRSLVIASSIGGLQDQQLLDLGRRLRPKEFEALPPEIRELGPEYRAANPEGVRRWLGYERNSAHPGSPPTPLKNRLTLALIETIRTPALLLTGDADLYAPPAVQHMFAAHMSQPETIVLPATGHNAYWEMPAAFNSSILTFLAKH